jgi:hypothetical protein
MKTFFYGKVFEMAENNVLLIDDSGTYNFQNIPFGDQQTVKIAYRF